MKNQKYVFLGFSFTHKPKMHVFEMLPSPAKGLIKQLYIQTCVFYL